MSTPLFSEAIKLKDGILYNLEYHQKRVDRTLKYFFEASIDLDILPQAIPSDKETGLYKFRLVYDREIKSIEYIPYSIADKTSVKVVIDNNIDYNYKFVDRNILNALLYSSNSSDIIIVKNGMVTDSSSANLVFESYEGELFTPKDCLLQGTKRQYLLDKRCIVEKSISLNEITTFKRIFFINAMIDLEDNISIDPLTITM